MIFVVDVLMIVMYLGTLHTDHRWREQLRITGTGKENLFPQRWTPLEYLRLLHSGWFNLEEPIVILPRYDHPMAVKYWKGLGTYDRRSSMR